MQKVEELVTGVVELSVEFDDDNFTLKEVNKTFKSYLEKFYPNYKFPQSTTMGIHDEKYVASIRFQGTRRMIINFDENTTHVRRTSARTKRPNLRRLNSQLTDETKEVPVKVATTMTEIKVEDVKPWVVGFAKINHMRGETNESQEINGTIHFKGRLLGDHPIDGHIHSDHMFLILIDEASPEDAKRLTNGLRTIISGRYDKLMDQVKYMNILDNDYSELKKRLDEVKEQLSKAKENLKREKELGDGYLKSLSEASEALGFNNGQLDLVDKIKKLQETIKLLEAA